MKKSKLQGPSASNSTEYEPTRTGLSPDTLARALRDNLYYAQGRMPVSLPPFGKGGRGDFVPQGMLSIPKPRRPHAVPDSNRKFGTNRNALFFRL